MESGTGSGDWSTSYLHKGDPMKQNWQYIDKYAYVLESYCRVCVTVTDNNPRDKTYKI